MSEMNTAFHWLKYRSKWSLVLKGPVIRLLAIDVVRWRTWCRSAVNAVRWCHVIAHQCTWKAASSTYHRRRV